MFRQSRWEKVDQRKTKKYDTLFLGQGKYARSPKEQNNGEYKRGTAKCFNREQPNCSVAHCPKPNNPDLSATNLAERRKKNKISRLQRRIHFSDIEQCSQNEQLEVLIADCFMINESYTSDDGPNHGITPSHNTQDILPQQLKAASQDQPLQAKTTDNESDL